jgi:hypothetical protein
MSVPTWLESPWIKDAAFVVTVACAATCIHAASKRRSSMPCIFLSLALMGMAWAVLIPYYGEPSGLELLNAFSGLLLILVGATLRLHVRIAQMVGGTGKLLPALGHDAWGLNLLVLLLVPHVVELPFGSNLRWLKPVFHAWVGTIILLLGFWSIYHAVRRLTPSNALRAVILFSVVPYAALEVSYSVRYSQDYVRAYDGKLDEHSSQAAERKPTESAPRAVSQRHEAELQREAETQVSMPGSFRIAFALAKIALTATFIVVVLRSIPAPQPSTAD